MKQMCRDCKNNHSHDHNHSHGEGKNAGETESFFRFWKLEIFTALLFVAGIILRHTGVLAAIDGNIGFDIARWGFRWCEKCWKAGATAV